MDDMDFYRGPVDRPQRKPRAIFMTNQGHHTFFQQFKSSECLMSFLSTKVGYETALRGHHLSIVVFYSTLIVVFCGGVSVALLSAWPVGRTAFGVSVVIGAVVVYLIGLVIVLKLIAIHNPDYSVVLCKSEELKIWWDKHLDGIGEDSAKLARLDRDEKAVLLKNLSDMATVLDEENRRRGRQFRKLRPWIYTLVTLGPVVLGSGVWVRLSGDTDGPTAEKASAGRNEAESNRSERGSGE